MIPAAITRDLRAGHGLDETLRKHGTNLRELFKSNERRKKIAVLDEWSFIQPTKSNTFRVGKCINGARIEFGTYKSHEDAISVRDDLIECGWDKSRLQDIIESNGISGCKRGGYRGR